VVLLKVKETVKEVVAGIIPIIAIITLLQVTIVTIPWEMYANFLAGTVLLICGLVLFLIGVNSSFLPIGEMIGSALVETGQLRTILIFAFIIGFSVTLPEPDVQVLAAQAAAISEGTIDKTLLILFIAVGVGLFVVVAMLRVFLDTPVAYILMVGYAIAFCMIYLVDSNMSSIAFDASGVTTGSLTVPFILSLGMGVSAVVAKKNASESSFGILAIASLGPILTVLALGVYGR